MLDGLLSKGFVSKCKSPIKTTKMRIETIRRKRNATEKILKKDIADLLANGLDVNAFGRAEGLLAEFSLSFCYDFVDQSCECVLKHLSVMQKQSGCPNEVIVSVASLMFSAARFSDLPELRDLRHIFQERYGSSIENYVHQQLVENITPKPPTMEKVFQLMQGIASEFAIKWDSEAFEQRMLEQSVLPQKPPKQYGPLHVTGNKNTLATLNNTSKKEKHDFPPRERHEDEQKLHNKREDGILRRKEVGLQVLEREESSDNRHNFHSGRGGSSLKRDEDDVAFQETSQVVAGKLGNGYEKEYLTPKSFRWSSSTHGYQPDYAQLTDKKDASLSIPKAVEEEETERLKSPHFLLPPPYVKPPRARKQAPQPVSNHADSASNNGVSDHEDTKKQAIDPGRRKDHNREKDQVGPGNVLPKPRSVRRQHSKAPTDDAGNSEVARRRHQRGKRGDDSRRGLQILFADEHDEEERVMDKLLLHYSKKPSTIDPEKLRKKLTQSKPEARSEDISSKLRSVSLPREQSAVEPVKVFTRAVSFEPDMSSAAPHVHPKLPDYDDLAAQFAALKR